MLRQSSGADKEGEKRSAMGYDATRTCADLASCDECMDWMVPARTFLKSLQAQVSQSVI